MRNSNDLANSYITLIEQNITTLSNAWTALIFTHYDTYRDITWSECESALYKIFDHFLPRWRCVDADDFLLGSLNRRNERTLSMSLAKIVNMYNLNSISALVLCHKIVSLNLEPPVLVLKAYRNVFGEAV